MIKIRIANFMEALGYPLLAFSVITIPLFASSKSINYYIQPKQFIFVLLLSFVLAAVAVKSFIDKQFVFYQSAIDKPAILLLVSLLLSALFNRNIDSLIGRGDYFFLSGLLLTFFIILTWSILLNLSSIRRWQAMINLFVVSGGLVSLGFLLNLFSGINLIKFLPGAWSTIDISNTNLGFYLVSVFLVSIGQVLKKDVFGLRSMLFSVVSLLSFFSILVLGFKVVFSLVFLGVVLIGVVGNSYKNEMRSNWSLPLLASMALISAFAFFGPPNFLNNKIPAEAALSSRPSWTIVSNSVFSGVKNFAFGNGPGSFRENFSKYRESNFNYDSTVANLRFNYPSNTFFSMLSETGVLSLFAFVVLVITLILLLSSVWKESKQNKPEEVDLVGNGFLDAELTMANHAQALETILLAVPWVVLTIGMGLLYYTFVLWWAWWFMLGLLVVGMALFRPGIIKPKVIELRDDPHYRPAFYSAIFAVSAVLVFFPVWNLKLSLADRYFAKALAAAEFKDAEQNLLSALKYRDNFDLYHAALARAYLNEAINLSRVANPDQKQIGEMMAKAVSEARKATELSPRVVSLWENLADMYENAAILVPEAREWAVKSLVSARELEPTNAFLASRLGNNYGLQGKWKEATLQFEEAIDLKKDMFPAYVALASAYEQNKEADKAISLLGTAVQTTDNPDILYNYGRLLYNRNQKDDRREAEKLWLAVVEKNPTHSNALYSLGLLNELKKKYSVALDYYIKVRELNPDNKEIVQKINKLQR